MTEQKIPIVIGVTGHRNLCPKDIPALKTIIASELSSIQKEYPHSPIQMLNAMASGADLLCADVAIQQGISLLCSLPMSEEMYRDDFSEEDWKEYKRLSSQAHSIFTSPWTEPYQDGREYLYRQVGIYIASHSHVLLALWDGSPAKPEGCGTAEVVEFMLNGSYNDGHYFNASNDGAVIHIQTNRTDSERKSITTCLLEDECGSLKKVLKSTDLFNKDTGKAGFKQNYALLPKEYVHHPLLKKLQAVYLESDFLSMKWQKRFLKVLALLASFSVFLVLFYLLYDEAELNICLIGYGAIVSLYVLINRVIERNRDQERYLQYRALSEALRVQFYFRALGIKDNVCHDFTWTQKHDATWIKEAINALLIGPDDKCNVPIDIVKESWIDGQQSYHEKAFLRTTHKHRIQEITTVLMIVLTLCTWLLVFILEYGYPYYMEMIFWGLSLRTWFKILWGCFSAVSVFISSYYGKLSLERKIFDHKKMSLLFSSASKQYNAHPTDYMQMFYQLGKEELIENGNWVSYNKENAPDFSI